ncbi:YidB family protein [Streptomyces sp. NPDC012888]|uniref:YidB family protein n=1 Tax=Streptomyces sp. NPDC012888 TaxID=3364855 RepID=UPI0036860023
MAGNDLGSLLGGLLGGGQGGGGSNVLGALLGALTSGGGAPGAQTSGNGNPLGGLLDMLTRSGLADQARSWVGTGENQPVSGSQIKEALPDDTLREVAQRVGVSPEQAADELAQTLPGAVDKLTPNGAVPTESLEDIVRKQGL